MIERLLHRGVGAVTLLQIGALVLPVAVVAGTAPPAFGGLLAATAITALTWEAVFSALRGYPMSYHGISTALIVAILLPAEAPLWHVAIVLSLGVVLGELIFGGRGFGFASPAAVTLALMLISFPQSTLGTPTEGLALATLPGAALLLAFGLIPWRVVLAVFLAAFAAMALGGQEIDPMAVGVALAFGVTFVICDPVAAAATPPGQWFYGALCGGLIVLFSPPGVPVPEALVFAALLGSVFAPLIDHLVVLAHARRRRRRHV